MKNAPEKVAIYEADVVEHADNILLTHGGLVLFALLSGGDYSKGIEGCGTAVSLGLARSHLGDKLLHILEAYSGDQLEVQLGLWTQELKLILQTNCGGLLRSSHPSIANQVSSSFPDRQILALYTSPLTSWSLTSTLEPPSGSLWVPCQPDIVQIAKLCSKHFDWSTSKELVKNFQNIFWPGVFMRIIASVSFKLLHCL